MVAIVGILVVVAIAAAWQIAQEIPLGWDEAVYASRSRSLVNDLATSTWRIHRAPGLPIVGLLGGVFGFTDANLRAVVVLLNLGSLTMAWVFARALWGSLAGLVALVTIVGSPVVVTEIALFHTDLPAAGLLFALMLVVWNEFERRPEPGWLLLAAAPLAALAFYIRFGSILPIGGIGLATAVLWHRSVVHNTRLVGATIVLAAFLFTPHVVDALSRTGSPLGIITSAIEQADTSWPLATAFRYLWWLPVRLAHLLGSAVVLVGVVRAAIVLRGVIRGRELTPVARRYLWLFIPAGVTTVGLILRSHPEPRYVLFPVVLAIIAGASGAAAAGTAWLRRRPRLAGRRHGLDEATIGALLLIGVVAGSVAAGRLVALQRLGDESRWLLDVGRAVDADRDGPCAAVTSVAPIIEWYSRCAATQFGSGVASLEAGSSAVPVYVVFTDIDVRRVSPGTIKQYRVLVQDSMATRIPVDGAPAGVAVYRLSR